MTIDQRLERLTERHEVLTQSVELMASMHEEAFLKNDESLRKNQVLISQILESVNGLARIAHAHEERTSDLENGRA